MPTVVQQRTLAPRGAGWTDSVTFDQTDPASGVTSLATSLTGTLSSAVWIYNLEPTASPFSSTDNARITLDRPNASALLAAGPSTTVSAILPGLPNSTTGATPSAIVATHLTADNADTATNSDTASTSPSPSPSPDAALFIGTGTVTLPVVATARVSASAPGNFGALFDSQIGATVSDTATTAGPPATGSTGDSSVFTVTTIPPGQVLYDTGSITTPTQHVQIAPAMTGWTQALGIAGFDPTLGRLESVNITITTNETAGLLAENLEPIPGTLHVAQTATIDIDAGATVLASQTATLTTNTALGAFDGAIDHAGPSGETLVNTASSHAIIPTLADPASLAAFTGPAAATLTVASIGRTTIDGPGALSIAAGLQAGASIDVSYTYLPTAGPLFDAAYYLAHNPDVAAAGVDPYQHYLTSGWHEGRDPSAYFDTNYYLTQNPDVQAAGVDPLLHFAQSGWHEGRDPSLLFSAAKYLAANPAANPHSDPLAQLALSNGAPVPTFLTGGTAAADPLIDTAYYDHQLGATLIPSGTAGAQQAAWSYDATGWQTGLNPDAFFDTSYYLSHNPDVAAAHIDPLLHYETSGWKEGRDPSAAFSTDKYLAAYSDVNAAGMDPLLHYIVSGQAEHRTAFSA